LKFLRFIDAGNQNDLEPFGKGAVEGIKRLRRVPDKKILKDFDLL